MADRVTVAVVSWNTREMLRECLRSLSPDAEAGRADVWVVDNDSSDGSAEMVAAEFPWASLIAAGENLGYGRAVNLVARRTSSRWLAASNADVALGADALRSLIEAAERHPGAGALAPRLVTPSGDTQQSLHSFPGPALSLVVNLGVHRLVPGLGERLCLDGRWDPDRPREVSWAHGAFLLLRRDAFEQIGGFDEDQWMYAEDLDLAWRLRRAGWTVRYEPAAVVRHAVAAATRQAFAAERAGRHVAASYRWMRRRRGPVATRLCWLVNTLGAAARWLALWPLARMRPRDFGAACDRARIWTGAHLMGPRRSLRTR